VAKKDRQVNLDDGGGSGPRRLWFRLEDDEAGPEMVATAKAIETSQADRQAQMLRQARLFTNQWLTSLYDLASARKDARIGPWNVIAAGVSTAQSMICRSAVNVSLETSGAEYSTQRLARDATRWLYGVWAENNLATEVGPVAFQDAGVVDVGIAVARVIERRLVIERVMPNEVIVSEIEALYGNPHQIFIKKFWPRHTVLDQYGKDEKKRDAIMAIGAESPGAGMGYRADFIPIYEGWAKKGKHVIAVRDCTLEAEPWKYDFLPTLPLYIDRPSAGYYGRGYAQQLMGYQIQLLQINDAIDEHIRLLAAAKWCLENGSGIDPADLDNEIGGVVTKSRGAADPKLLVGPVVSKDLFEERQRIYDTALQEIGLNTWSVKGQEPASRSGVAMEVARDKEKGRILTAGQLYEQWFVEIAKVCFALGSETTGTEYKGRGPADKDLSSVDFATIAEFIKDKPWRVKPFPVSALPEGADARRKVIEGWLEAGMITAPVAISMLELPDVDAEASLMSAAREDIMWSIEEIVEKGRDGYRTPEKHQDLELGLRMFDSAWLKYRRQGLDEKRLDLLDKWMTEAQALIKPPAPVAVEQRPGVGTAPAQVMPVDPMAAGMPANDNGGMPVDAGAPPPELGGPPPGAPPPELAAAMPGPPPG
jgi:hypothetical protein